jgi:hypothetical protein
VSSTLGNVYRASVEVNSLTRLPDGQIAATTTVARHVFSDGVDDCWWNHKTYTFTIDHVARMASITDVSDYAPDAHCGSSSPRARICAGSDSALCTVGATRRELCNLSSVRLCKVRSPSAAAGM